MQRRDKYQGMFLGLEVWTLQATCLKFMLYICLNNNQAALHTCLGDTQTCFFSKTHTPGKTDLEL